MMTPYLLQVVGALLFTLSGLATSANLRRSRSLHTGEATSRCPIQPMNLEPGKWFDDPWDRNMGCRIDINHACYPEGLSEEEANAACQQWYAENCGSTADDGTYAEAYAASLEDHPGLCRIRLRHPDGWEEVNYHPYTATMASDSDNHVLPNNEYFNGCKVNYLLHPPAYSEEFGCEWFINDYCPELNADDFIIAVSEREDVNGRRVCGMARKDAPDSEPEPEPEPSPTPAPSPSPSAEPSEEECSYGAVTIGMYTCMESTDHEIDQIYPSPWIEESFVPIEGVQMTKFGGIRVYRQGDPEYGTQEGNLLPVKPYAVYSGDDVEAFKDWFSTAESNFLQYTASKGLDCQALERQSTWHYYEFVYDIKIPNPSDDPHCTFLGEVMDSSASALWEHDRVFRDPEFRGLWASYEVLGDDTIRWTSTFRMRHPELGLRFFEWVLDTENRLRDVLFHLPYEILGENDSAIPEEYSIELISFQERKFR